MNTRGLPAAGVVVALGFATISVGNEKRPAPPGCHWQSIPELKAHLAVPDGWLFEQIASQDGLVYQVRPPAEELASRYRLEVRTGVDTSAVVGEARDFVDGPRNSGAEAEPLEEQTKGVITAYSTVVYYRPLVAGAPAITVAYLALGNSRTGTIYKIRLDIPADEVDRVLPAANHLFQNIRVDDEI